MYCYTDTSSIKKAGNQVDIYPKQRIPMPGQELRLGQPGRHQPLPEPQIQTIKQRKAKQLQDPTVLARPPIQEHQNLSSSKRKRKKKKNTNHSRYGSINRRSSQILQQQSRIRGGGGWNVRRSCEGGLATWSRRNPQAPATSLPLVSRMIARRMLWASIREREEKGRGRKGRRRRPTMRREDAEDEELAMVVAKSWRPGAL